MTATSKPAASHTPGPWTVNAYRADGGVNCVYVQAAVKRVTVAQCMNGPCAAAPTPEQLADARLIAAAPEMLDACRAAESILRAYIPADQFDGHASKALAMVSKAIRKATSGDSQ